MNLGTGRLSEDLQDLQHATSSIYTEEEGYYVWGQRLVLGVSVELVPVGDDITATPGLGLSPLGVQFNEDG